MKQLRAIRIVLGSLFLAASAACLIIGPQVHPMADAAAKLQIRLSAASLTLGVTIVWLLITFLAGRIYCASVCPIGVFSDIFIRIRRSTRRLNKPFSYRHRSKWGIHILWIYAICVLAGVMAVPFVIEPWDMARNMASTINPEAIDPTWPTIGLGIMTGMIAGIISAAALVAVALRYGRAFCTEVCPIGTMLGYVQDHGMSQIEFDPDKCISCGHCEDICRSQCIKVVSRYVDASRCVRCFDCVAECTNGAIRYQFNPSRRPASPLMRKVKNTNQ